ncbi:hypothetical protein Fcan01_04226 [Folsomia candida]|uniref:Uncharacterized protein n=2 Tax=Folsomia candida TaxID=158441 RepID=A0A226EPT1_FOLCA|nr:hypothetical protein Fcan01_04226 [Folsomia candida]
MVRLFGVSTIVLVATTFLIAYNLTELLFSNCSGRGDDGGRLASPTPKLVNPFCNGSMGMRLGIIILQNIFNLTSFIAFYMACINWWYNYEMGVLMRHVFVMWSFVWIMACIVGVGLAFSTVISDPVDNERAILYETFSKHYRNWEYIRQLEWYQKENNCCGIFGADDWLIPQFRLSPSQMIGRFADFNYGFRNPPTGKCHLSLDKFKTPTGCGDAILKTYHLSMFNYGAILFVQAFLGLVAAYLAGKAFLRRDAEKVSDVEIPEIPINNIRTSAAK